jgi:glycosyltransferase involved in cell wall biosynthesis
LEANVKNILIISPEQWDAHSVSKHHYAITLAARGSSVFFLNPPDDSISGIQIQTESSSPRLYVVSAPRVSSGLRFYPSLLRRLLEKRWLLRLEKVAACKITVIWLFENSRFFDMRFAGGRLKIYHQVDLNQGFHPASAAATADICFCTTDFIKLLLLPYNDRVYKIHHGLARLGSPDEVAHKVSLFEAEQSKFDFDGVNVFCIGNLDMLYLDADLLVNLARQFAAVRFHYVGGFSAMGHLRSLASELHNVVWWGKVESALIPYVLEHADVLLVAYKAADYREQLASPHKMMEYLASGKTVVATYTDEYKDKRHLLEMVDDSSDYLAAFERVVCNLAEYNSPERQAERKSFAQVHTYENQLGKIVNLLKQNRLISD